MDIFVYIYIYICIYIYIGNTMIEEVTALLMGIATGRAVLFDVRGNGIFGLERPAHYFNRPLALDFEMLLPLFADVEELERRGAARYALLLCLAVCCSVV